MNAAYSPALDQALAAHRTPGLYATLRERSLPSDILLLLRVAGRDSAALDQVAAASGESSAQVREAVMLYIQHLMFFAGSDSFRVLGVAPDAPDATIKENYRWLVRWLHPDKNEDQWDAVYADRVTLAWQDLRTPERRRDYSDRLVAETLLVPEPSPVPLRRMVPAAKLPQDEFVLSTKTVRRLPAAILLSVTLLAALVLGLQYYEISDAPAPAELAVVEPATPTPPAAPVPAPRAPIPPVPASTAPLVIERPESAPVVPDSEPVPLPLPALPAAIAEAPVAKVAPAPAPASPPEPRVRQDEPPKAVAPVAVAPVPPPRAAAPTTPPSPRASPASEALAVSARLEPETSELINAAIAREVLLRFRSAYSSGNIKQMQSLLSREGEIPAAERELLIDGYRELFKSSDRRHMKIRNPSWMTREDTAILVASYEAWIQPRGKRQEKHVTGDIRFDLRQEDGELRIVRLRHDAKGG